MEPDDGLGRYSSDPEVAARQREADRTRERYERLGWDYVDIKQFWHDRPVAVRRARHREVEEN